MLSSPALEADLSCCLPSTSLSLPHCCPLGLCHWRAGGHCPGNLGCLSFLQGSIHGLLSGHLNSSAPHTDVQASSWTPACIGPQSRLSGPCMHADLPEDALPVHILLSPQLCHVFDGPLPSSKGSWAHARSLQAFLVAFLSCSSHLQSHFVFLCLLYRHLRACLCPAGARPWPSNRPARGYHLQ